MSSSTTTKITSLDEAVKIATGFMNWPQLKGADFESSFTYKTEAAEQEPALEVQFRAGGTVGGVCLNETNQTLTITTVTGARSYSFNLETGGWVTYDIVDDEQVASSTATLRFL